MTSVRVQSVVLGASLCLGVLDIVWLDVRLAPRVLASSDEAPSSTVIAANPAVEPAPPPVVKPAAVAAEPARPAVVEPAQPAPEPPRPIPEPPAPPAPPAPPVTTEQVYFASTSAELHDTARARLQEIVERAGVDAAFLLEGHADRRGENEFNFDLGQRRAEAVRDHLVELGVTSTRIRALSHGELQARARDALWRDRRVEIQITGGSK